MFFLYRKLISILEIGLEVATGNLYEFLKEMFVTVEFDSIYFNLKSTRFYKKPIWMKLVHICFRKSRFLINFIILRRQYSWLQINVYILPRKGYLIWFTDRPCDVLTISKQLQWIIWRCRHMKMYTHPDSLFSKYSKYWLIHNTWAD